MKEETGYHAVQWDYLGHFYSSPGLCTEQMHLYLARQLTSAAPAPADDEAITIELIPLTDAVARIERGEIVDAKTIVGLLRVWRLVNQAISQPGNR